MIVSHKHKFIFVKTHKTSTQTFLKFIKPHLGPNDVMAGDKGLHEVNEDTVINIDKTFDASGKCAEDLQAVYGNHIPWFMIRDVVGQEMWDEYTTFTIERSPLDRFLSLFYFLHPTLCKLNAAPSKTKLIDQRKILEESKGNVEQRKNIVEEFKKFKTSTLLELDPEAVREYFEDWMLVQLLTKPEGLMEYDSYGLNSHQAIIDSTNNTADKLKLEKYKKLWELNPRGEQPKMRAKEQGECPFQRQIEFAEYNLDFPYSKNKDVNLPPNVQTWQREVSDNSRHIYRTITGQARFLNYGYYWDGKKITVDHIVDFKNVGDNMGSFFKKYNIDINCDKEEYSKATQNAHFRKNIKSKPDNDWWYKGKKGKRILKVINKQYNFINKII